MPLSTLSRSIEGQVAIVTGVASGMGRATARLFGDEGVRVALIDISEVRLRQVVTEMTDVGYDAKGWGLDLSDVDILVNNAGIGAGAAIDDEDYFAVWNRAVAIMLAVHVHTIRASLPYIRKSAYGRIVNIASTEGLGATKNISPYTTAKTGIIDLTRSLAVELGPEAISVNCICPGPIRTGMTADIPDEHKEIFAKRRVALHRYAELEEVAHSTLSLVLPASQYITGVALLVDGGLTIKNA